MSAKHTPGPWMFVFSIPEEGFECFWIESDDEFRNAIAEVIGPQDEESTANARLIAAAPDLLEVAQSIIAEDMLQYLPAEYVAKVRAAIKKATGEQ